jgi:hypothetical protein
MLKGVAGCFAKAKVDAGAYRGGGMRLAGSRDFHDEARWRVFVSHTSELRDYPEGRSYVAAVERAISAAGHVIVDMADFAAAGQAPAQLCAERVRGCEVYVGVLGTRYGSPVRDRPEVSYTELEFDTATEAGLDRLVFLLDTGAAGVGIPIPALLDREFGARQDAFRRRVLDSGLTTQLFANPDALGQLVERSLRDLADTRRRIGSGIRREQVPTEPQQGRVAKYATNRIFLSYRHEETAWQAGWLADTLVGHFGAGVIFKDIDSIEPGDDFVEAINNAVSSCDVLLALIGKEWLTITDDTGQRRIDNPRDFVRLEIEAALTRKVRVIPILIEGARMPRADQLPAGLVDLERRQALELSPRRYKSDADRLVKVLEKTLTKVQAQSVAKDL